MNHFRFPRFFFLAAGHVADSGSASFAMPRLIKRLETPSVKVDTSCPLRQRLHALTNSMVIITFYELGVLSVIMAPAVVASAIVWFLMSNREVAFIAI